MAGVETCITSIMDSFSFLREKASRKYYVITLICLFHFVLSLPYVFQSGTYWIGEIYVAAAKYNIN